MSFLSVNCKKCGSPLNISPDSLLNICEYCGYAYSSSEIKDIPIYITPSLSKDEIIKSFNSRMANDSNMRNKHCEIVEVKGVYVPLYITNISAYGNWKGTRTEGSGKYRRTVTLTGNIDLYCDFPIIARKYAHEFGLPQIGDFIFRAPFNNFEKIEWQNISLPVLSVDIREEDSELITKDDFVDELGDQIKGNNRLDKFDFFNCKVAALKKNILLFPLWTVVYRYEGGTYRVAVEGGSGNVISAMEPMFNSQRAMYFAGALGLGAVAGILWHIIWLILTNSDDGDVMKIVILILIGMGISLYTAFILSKRILKSVRIESVHNEPTMPVWKKFGLFR